MDVRMLRQPSAVIPVVMSLAALTLVVTHFFLYGIVQESDEGTPAHIFQLLMAGQIPVIAFFAIYWMPRTPGPALRVLMLHGLAGTAAVASVYFLT